MKLSVKFLAIGLAIGIVGAPAQAHPGHGYGHRGGWHHDRGGRGYGYRHHGFHGGRRICRTYHHHVTRCFWR